MIEGFRVLGSSACRVHRVYRVLGSQGYRVYRVIGF